MAKIGALVRGGGGSALYYVLPRADGYAGQHKVRRARAQVAAELAVDILIDAIHVIQLNY